MSEHAVLVSIEGNHVNLDAIHAMERQLIEALEKTPVGEMDGHEVAIAMDEATFYLYGPDADIVFAAIADSLRSDPLTEKARITLRYGEAADPDATEKSFELAPSQ